MSLKTQTKNNANDIAKYTNKSIQMTSQRNLQTKKLLERFFSNMQEKDTVTNSQLVEYLKDKGVVFKDKEIKTDLPLFQSVKTEAMKSKLVTREKLEKVYVYTKV